jgi:O-antigen/teichoic acid export membrane protein
VARCLPVAEFGRFTAALAFASIAAVIVDSGMGMLAAKDIAKKSPDSLTQLDQIFTWRLWMIAAACGAALILGRFLLPSEAVRHAAFLLTPGVLLIGMSDFFCWIFKGAQRAVGCAFLQISSRLILLAACLVAVFRPQPLHSLLAAYGITGLLVTAIGMLVLGHSLHPLKSAPLPHRFFSHTIPGIYKLGAILILSVAFTRVDIMLVARLRGDTDAGFFSAAGRIIDALRLVPMVAYSVYMPLFSAAHDQPEVLRSHFKDAYEVLLALAVVISIAGTLLAGPLFHYVLGPQYDGAVVCFRPLLWGCVFMFTNILMFSLLYARNDHLTPFFAIAAAIAVEVALDVLWLPRYGLVAAAWSRLIAEGVNGLTLAAGLLHTKVLGWSFGF